MKTKTWIKRVDGVRQRYHTGRTPKQYSSKPETKNAYGLSFGMGLEPALSSAEREEFIKAELKKSKRIPPDKQTDDEIYKLVEITAGLGKEGIKDVIWDLEQDYKPLEQIAKDKGFDVRAIELGESLWRAIGGGSIESSADNALFMRKRYEANEKAIAGFSPDKTNHHVWRALMKDPQKIEFWKGSTPGHPVGPVKSIKKLDSYGNEEIWAVVDSENEGATITFYPKTGRYEMNSPHTEEEDYNGQVKLDNTPKELKTRDTIKKNKVPKERQKNLKEMMKMELHPNQSRLKWKNK